MTEEGRDVINISSSLLAILCLTRYEDWTFREAEMRLGEHQELRAALGLEQAPDDTTLFRVLWRVDTEVRTRALAATVARLPPSPSQVANGMVVAASRGSPRRGWPPPQRAATSWILPATGALSGHASSGRSWAEAGPKLGRSWVAAVDVPRRAVWGNLPTLLQCFVRSSIWHSRQV